MAECRIQGSTSLSAWPRCQGRSWNASSWVLSCDTWNQGIRPSQDGFVKGKSCLTNLIPFHDKETHLVDEREAADVSTWTLVKPLTSFPMASLGETGCPWLGQVCSWLGRKLSRWPGPGSVGEWNYVQLVTGHQWCSPGLGIGASPV